VEFAVDKVALGQVFSEYFGFPCQFLFHQLLHIYHHLSSGAGTIGQLMADEPSGLSLIPPQETKKSQIDETTIKFTLIYHSCLSFIPLLKLIMISFGLESNFCGNRMHQGKVRLE
jgi:hypothetical protein